MSLIERIAEMHSRGMRPKTIARALPANIETVKKSIYRLRKRGALMRPSPHQYQDLLKEVLQLRPIASLQADEVRTCGDCTPARGVLIASYRGWGFVMFYGCDRPVVWPIRDLEPCES